MSTNRRIAFGTAAQWVSRVVSIVLGLVLMPVLLDNLPKEEVGIWLLLGQSWAVMGILDLGFSYSLTRRIALAKGKSGGGADVTLSSESIQEIADLMTVGKRVYRIMAAGVFVVSWSLGFFYLRNLELKEIDLSVIWIAWTILCACNALNVWAAIWGCLLQGTGNVGWDGLLATVVQGTTLLSQIIAVLMGGGIVSLAIIATIGAVGQRQFLRWFTLRRNAEVAATRGHWNPKVTQGMIGLSLKAWLTSLGGVLVFNTDSFFIASAEGAEDIPAFRAAFLVVLNLHVLTCAISQASSVFMTQLWQADEREEVRRILQRNLRAGFCLMACGGIAILWAGDALFNVWLGTGNYVGATIVSLFVILFALEQQSFIIATGCRATEFEPFAVWMMVGGLVKLALAPTLMANFGLLGLAIATLVSQVALVHGYVAFRGFRRLEFAWTRYLNSVVLPCTLFCSVAALLSGGLVLASAESPDWFRLLASCTGSGGVLMLAAWALVLDGSQRDRICQSVSAFLRTRLGQVR
jgi:O-antigen/teichoic acid export membrane protein